MERYNFKIVEKKWQEFWSQNQTFKSEINKDKKKFLTPASQVAPPHAGPLYPSRS